MPIRNCQIISWIDNNTTILLPIRVSNPYTGKAYKTWGLIDTGASECAIPADIAIMLGHNLYKGEKKTINTGNGAATAYRHTTSITIHHPDNTNKVIHTLDNVLIDCMPNLNAVLLGVRGFLSNFSVNIDYPNRIFSLIK